MDTVDITNPPIITMAAAILAHRRALGGRRWSNPNIAQLAVINDWVRRGQSFA
jgi:hypothetical protein